MIPPWYWIFIEYSLKLPEGNITKIPLFADEIPIFLPKTTVPDRPVHRWNGKQVPKVGSPLLSPDSLRRAAGVSWGWQRGTLGFRETSVKYISIPRDVGFVGE